MKIIFLKSEASLDLAFGSFCRLGQVFDQALGSFYRLRQGLDRAFESFCHLRQEQSVPLILPLGLLFIYLPRCFCPLFKF